MFHGNPFLVKILSLYSAFPAHLLPELCTPGCTHLSLRSCQRFPVLFAVGSHPASVAGQKHTVLDAELLARRSAAHTTRDRCSLGDSSNWDLRALSVYRLLDKP